MSELIPLPSTINLKILTPAPNQKISLHAIAARKSMTDKVPVLCKCKDKHSWCATWRYICVKAGISCGVAYHEKRDNDNIECSNCDIPHLRLQNTLRVRNRNDEKESSKRQRRRMVGKGRK